MTVGVSDVTKSRARGVDLIREGVSKQELKLRGSRAVFSALISTAMTWQNRDWSYDMWVSTLREPQSQLFRQVQLDNRKMPRTANAVNRDLRSAWKKAEGYTAERPALTRADIREAAAARLDQLDSLEKAAWPLDDRALLVLRHVLETAAEIGTTAPAIPVREAMTATHLPNAMAAQRALRRLEEKDLIRCVERGRRGRGKSSGRASLFTWDTPGMARLLRGSSQCPYGAISNAEQDASPAISNGERDSASNAPHDMSNADRDSVRNEAHDMSNGTTEEYVMEPITIRLADGKVTTVEIPDGPKAREQVLSMLKAAGAEIETSQKPDAIVTPLRRAN